MEICDGEITQRHSGPEAGNWQKNYVYNMVPTLSGPVRGSQGAQEFLGNLGCRGESGGTEIFGKYDHQF